MSIAICKHSDCSKSDQCKRFATQEGEVILFKNICDELNNYKWFLQDDNKLQTAEKVETKEIQSEDNKEKITEEEI